MAKIRYVLTGTTGLIGRNLLFEILKSHKTNLDEIQIFILGRAKAETSLQERIFRMLQEDGVFYISKDPAERQKILDSFKKVCVCINFDLTASVALIDRAGMAQLTKAPIDYFYHVGASTDLRDGSVVEGVLLRTNIQGTQNVLSLLSELDVGLLSYVGTAYSCGEVEGDVAPNYANIRQKFRNPYERSKLLAEIMVREYGRETGLRFKIFRPSVTGGRLSEEPIGSVNKFDVFYGWAAFFLALKKKHVQENDREKFYSTKLPLDIRICFNKNSGLNIVPADFVAKAMFLISTKNIATDGFHMVAKNAMPHDQYISAMLNYLGITGVRFVSSIPTDKTQYETLYYRTAGKILTPYISAKPIRFSVANYEDEIRKYGLEVPTMTVEKFTKLLEYAGERDFDLAKVPA